MKKKYLILAALSASMLLAGCNNNNNNNSSSPVSSDAGSVASSEASSGSSSKDSGASSSESSSEENVAERKAALAAFIKNVGPNNTTMTLTIGNGTAAASYTYYYMGADAFLMSDGTANQGILVNNNQGFFLFSVDEGKVNLHGCQGLGNDITASFTTPSGVFTDSDFYQYINLSGKDYTFTLNTKQMIKDLTSYMSKGTGSTCLYYLLNLVGSSGKDYKYVNSGSLTLAPDGSYADVVVKLASGRNLVTYSCHLSDFGTTDVKAVSDYLAEGKDIATPTGWDADCTKAISSVFTGKESDIVFPSGLISASFDQQALVYTKKDEDDDTSDSSSTTDYTYAGVQWTSFGKDLTTSYGAMLKTAGYEYVGSQVSSSDEYTHYYYEKLFTAQTEDSGAVYIECNFYYNSSMKEFTCQIYLGTDAIRYEYATVTEANAKIADINEAATYDIPTLAESDAINGNIKVADYTASYEKYAYYFVIDISFEKEEDALAYAEAYMKTISTSYSDTEKYSWADDGAVLYGAISGQSYAAMLQVVEGKTTSGGYAVEIVALGV